MTDVTADYLALRREAGAYERPRDFVMVQGPDAASFLQGQCSQDVEALAVGSAAWTLVLSPQGRLEAFARVLRSGDAAFILDVDAGHGDALEARLRRFLLRVKVELSRVPWRCWAVRGPETVARVGTPVGAVPLPASWPGLPGVDLAGPDARPPDGVRVCGPEAAEAVRIESGAPGPAETAGEPIPAELGIVERAVSFTKGCYTGQELVARIDSRGGNVPRHLRGVVVGTNVLPPPGAELRVGDDDVGRLTSVGESLDRRAPVALALVHRRVEPPAEVTVVWDGGAVPARVETLPLVADA